MITCARYPSSSVCWRAPARRERNGSTSRPPASLRPRKARTGNSTDRSGAAHPRRQAGSLRHLGAARPAQYLRDLAADLKPGDVSMLPWAEAVYKERLSGAWAREEPDANCLPQGVPKIDAAPAPYRFIQMPGMIVIIYEAFTQWRQIFMDGRELPKDPNPSWFGYSVGKWDGDTLVVDSLGFNGKSVARSGRSSIDRRAARHRTFPPRELRTAGDSGHDRRPEGVHQAVDGDRERATAAQYRAD